MAERMNLGGWIAQALNGAGISIEEAAPQINEILRDQYVEDHTDELEAEGKTRDDVEDGAIRSITAEQLYDMLSATTHVRSDVLVAIATLTEAPLPLSEETNLLREAFYNFKTHAPGQAMASLSNSERSWPVIRDQDGLRTGASQILVFLGEHDSFRSPHTRDRVNFVQLKADAAFFKKIREVSDAQSLVVAALANGEGVSTNAARFAEIMRHQGLHTSHHGILVANSVTLFDIEQFPASSATAVEEAGEMTPARIARRSIQRNLMRDLVRWYQAGILNAEAAKHIFGFVPESTDTLDQRAHKILQALDQDDWRSVSNVTGVSKDLSERDPETLKSPTVHPLDELVDRIMTAPNMEFEIRPVVALDASSTMLRTNGPVENIDLQTRLAISGISSSFDRIYPSDQFEAITPPQVVLFVNQHSLRVANDLPEGTQIVVKPQMDGWERISVIASNFGTTRGQARAVRSCLRTFARFGHLDIEPFEFANGQGIGQTWDQFGAQVRELGLL